MQELENKNIEILSSGFDRLPQITKQLNETQIADVEKLLEKIEEEEENDQLEEEIQKIEDLTEVEKKAFINLIVSMENKESKILEEITKKKNSDIIIDIKDIEIKKTKSNTISIKINFDEI